MDYDSKMMEEYLKEEDKTFYMSGVIHNDENLLIKLNDNVSLISLTVNNKSPYEF